MTWIESINFNINFQSIPATRRTTESFIQWTDERLWRMLHRKSPQFCLFSSVAWSVKWWAFIFLKSTVLKPVIPIYAESDLPSVRVQFGHKWMHRVCRNAPNTEFASGRHYPKLVPKNGRLINFSIAHGPITCKIVYTAMTNKNDSIIIYTWFFYL